METAGGAVAAVSSIVAANRTATSASPSSASSPASNPVIINGNLSHSNNGAAGHHHDHHHPQQQPHQQQQQHYPQHHSSLIHSNIISSASNSSNSSLSSSSSLIIGHGSGGANGGAGSSSTNSSGGSSNSSTSSNSSGYGSTSATPTNSYETHSTSTTPVAIAEPIIPVATTVATVSPFYSEAITNQAHETQNYSTQQHLQSQYPLHSTASQHLQQQHSQTNLNLSQQQQHPVPQQQSLHPQLPQHTQRSQPYLSSFASSSYSSYDYSQQQYNQQEATPLPHQQQLSHGPASSAYGLGSAGNFDTNSSHSNLQVNNLTPYQQSMGHSYKSSGSSAISYERQRSLSGHQAYQNESAAKHNQQFGQASAASASSGSLSTAATIPCSSSSSSPASGGSSASPSSSSSGAAASKSRSSSSLLASMSTSTSNATSSVATTKPQAAATPFYAQPLAQSQPAASYYADLQKHKMPLEYHHHDQFGAGAAGGFSNASVYHQQQKYYAAAKSQLKEASSYGPTAAKSLYASGSYYPGQHAAASSILPPNPGYMYPSTAYPTAPLGYESSSLEAVYRKNSSGATGQLNSSAWPWAMDYAAAGGSSRPVAGSGAAGGGASSAAGHLPTATVAPTHASYSSHHRDPYYLPADKYAMKYPAAAPPPPYQQNAYVSPPSARHHPHHLWPSAGSHSSLNDRLSGAPNHIPHATMHAGVNPYYAASTTPTGMSARQPCCPQPPYAAQNCYYPPGAAASGRITHGQPPMAAMGQAASAYHGSPQGLASQQGGHLVNQPALSKYSTNAMDYPAVNKLKPPANDLYLGAHYDATTANVPPSHLSHHHRHPASYQYAAAGAGSALSGNQALYTASNQMAHHPTATAHHPPAPPHPASHGQQPAGPLIAHDPTGSGYTNDLTYDSYLHETISTTSNLNANPASNVGSGGPAAEMAATNYAVSAAKRALLDYRKPQTQNYYHQTASSGRSEILGTGYAESSQHSGGDLLLSSHDTTSHNHFTNYENNTHYAINSNESGNMLSTSENAGKSSADDSTKNLSLRDFIANWNDDEEDYTTGNDELMAFDQQQQTGAGVINEVLQNVQVENTTNFPAEEQKSQKVPQEPQAGSTSLGEDIDAQNYTNLPDIIVDIEKSGSFGSSTVAPNVNETSAATSLTLDNFDVEKELDQLQQLQRKPGELDTVIVKPPLPANNCTTPAAEPSKKDSVETENPPLSFEDLNFETSKTNSTIPPPTRPTASAQNDAEGYDSSCSRHSNESSLFEKEYQTFINKISSSETQTKADKDIEQKVQDFSKFYKRKRKLRDETSVNKNNEELPAKENKKSRCSNEEDSSGKESNFPQAYTKKSRNRTLSHSSTNKSATKRRRKPSSFYYKAMQNIRRYPQHRSQMVKDYMADLKEKHLPLIKRQSIKNYSMQASPEHCAEVGPLPLKTLVLGVINSEDFRERFVINSEDVEEESAAEEKHICTDPTCETCEVIRSLMESEVAEADEGEKRAETSPSFPNDIVHLSDEEINELAKSEKIIVAKEVEDLAEGKVLLIPEIPQKVADDITEQNSIEEPMISEDNLAAELLANELAQKEVRENLSSLSGGVIRKAEVAVDFFESCSTTKEPTIQGEAWSANFTGNEVLNLSECGANQPHTSIQEEAVQNLHYETSKETLSESTKATGESFGKFSQSNELLHQTGHLTEPIKATEETFKEFSQSNEVFELTEPPTETPEPSNESFDEFGRLNEMLNPQIESTKAPEVTPNDIHHSNEVLDLHKPLIESTKAPEGTFSDIFESNASLHLKEPVIESTKAPNEPLREIAALDDAQLSLSSSTAKELLSDKDSVAEDMLNATKEVLPEYRNPVIKIINTGSSAGVTPLEVNITNQNSEHREDMDLQKSPKQIDSPRATSVIRKIETTPSDHDFEVKKKCYEAVGSPQALQTTVIRKAKSKAQQRGENSSSPKPASLENSLQEMGNSTSPSDVRSPKAKDKSTSKNPPIILRIKAQTTTVIRKHVTNPKGSDNTESASSYINKTFTVSKVSPKRSDNESSSSSDSDSESSSGSSSSSSSSDSSDDDEGEHGESCSSSDSDSSRDAEHENKTLKTLRKVVEKCEKRSQIRETSNAVAAVRRGECKTKGMLKEFDFTPIDLNESSRDSEENEGAEVGESYVLEHTEEPQNISSPTLFPTTSRDSQEKEANVDERSISEVPGEKLVLEIPEVNQKEVISPSPETPKIFPPISPSSSVEKDADASQNFTSENPEVAQGNPSSPSTETPAIFSPTSSRSGVDKESAGKSKSPLEQRPEQEVPSTNDNLEVSETSAVTSGLPSPVPSLESKSYQSPNEEAIINNAPYEIYGHLCSKASNRKYSKSKTTRKNEVVLRAISTLITGLEHDTSSDCESMNQSIEQRDKYRSCNEKTSPKESCSPMNFSEASNNTGDLTPQKSTESAAPSDSDTSSSSSSSSEESEDEETQNKMDNPEQSQHTTPDILENPANIVDITGDCTSEAESDSAEEFGEIISKPATPAKLNDFSDNDLRSPVAQDNNEPNEPMFGCASDDDSQFNLIAKTPEIPTEAMEESLKASLGLLPADVEKDESLRNSGPALDNIDTVVNENVTSAENDLPSRRNSCGNIDTLSKSLQHSMVIKNVETDSGSPNNSESNCIDHQHKSNSEEIYGNTSPKYQSEADNSMLNCAKASSNEECSPPNKTFIPIITETSTSQNEEATDCQNLDYATNSGGTIQEPEPFTATEELHEESSQNFSAEIIPTEESRIPDNHTSEVPSGTSDQTQSPKPQMVEYEGQPETSEKAQSPMSQMEEHVDICDDSTSSSVHSDHRPDAKDLESAEENKKIENEDHSMGEKHHESEAFKTVESFVPSSSKPQPEENILFQIEHPVQNSSDLKAILPPKQMQDENLESDHESDTSSQSSDSSSDEEDISSTVQKPQEKVIVDNESDTSSQCSDSSPIREDISSPRGEIAENIDLEKVVEPQKQSAMTSSDLKTTEEFNILPESEVLDLSKGAPENIDCSPNDAQNDTNDSKVENQTNEVVPKCNVEAETETHNPDTPFSVQDENPADYTASGSPSDTVEPEIENKTCESFITEEPSMASSTNSEVLVRERQSAIENQVASERRDIEISNSKDLDLEITFSKLSQEPNELMNMETNSDDIPQEVEEPNVSEESEVQIPDGHFSKKDETQIEDSVKEVSSNQDECIWTEVSEKSLNHGSPSSNIAECKSIIDEAQLQNEYLTENILQSPSLQDSPLVDMTNEECCTEFEREDSEEIPVSDKELMEQKPSPCSATAETEIIPKEMDEENATDVTNNSIVESIETSPIQEEISKEALPVQEAEAVSEEILPILEEESLETAKGPTDITLENKNIAYSITDPSDTDCNIQICAESQVSVEGPIDSVVSEHHEFLQSDVIESAELPKFAEEPIATEVNNISEPAEHAEKSGEPEANTSLELSEFPEETKESEAKVCPEFVKESKESEVREFPENADSEVKVCLEFVGKSVDTEVREFAKESANSRTEVSESEEIRRLLADNNSEESPEIVGETEEFSTAKNESVVCDVSNGSKNISNPTLEDPPKSPRKATYSTSFDEELPTKLSVVESQPELEAVCDKELTLEREKYSADLASPHSCPQTTQEILTKSSIPLYSREASPEMNFWNTKGKCRSFKRKGCDIAEGTIETRVSVVAEESHKSDIRGNTSEESEVENKCNIECQDDVAAESAEVESIQLPSATEDLPKVAEEILSLKDQNENIGSSSLFIYPFGEMFTITDPELLKDIPLPPERSDEKVADIESRELTCSTAESLSVTVDTASEDRNEITKTFTPNILPKTPSSDVSVRKENIAIEVEDQNKTIWDSSPNESPDTPPANVCSRDNAEHFNVSEDPVAGGARKIVRASSSNDCPKVDIVGDISRVSFPKECSKTTSDDISNSENLPIETTPAASNNDVERYRSATDDENIVRSLSPEPCSKTSSEDILSSEDDPNETVTTGESHDAPRSNVSVETATECEKKFISIGEARKESEEIEIRTSSASELPRTPSADIFTTENIPNETTAADKGKPAENSQVAEDEGSEDDAEIFEVVSSKGLHNLTSEDISYHVDAPKKNTSAVEVNRVNNDKVFPETNNESDKEILDAACPKESLSSSPEDVQQHANTLKENTSVDESESVRYFNASPDHGNTDDGEIVQTRSPKESLNRTSGDISHHENHLNESETTDATKEIKDSNVSIDYTTEAGKEMSRVSSPTEPLNPLAAESHRENTPDESNDFLAFKYQTSFDEGSDFNGFEDPHEEELLRREVENLNEDSTANDGFQYGIHNNNIIADKSPSKSSEFNELEALEKELSQHNLAQKHGDIETNADPLEKLLEGEGLAEADESVEDLEETEPQRVSITQNVSISTNDIEHIKKMLESDDEPANDEDQDVTPQKNASPVENKKTNSSTNLCVIPKLSDLCRAALNSSLNIENLRIVQKENTEAVVEVVVQGEAETPALTNNEPSPQLIVERELSVEETLAEMYRQAGVMLSDPEDNESDKASVAPNQDLLLINLQEILNSSDNDVYVLQCDLTANSNNENPANENPTTTSCTENNSAPESREIVLPTERFNTLQLIGIVNRDNESSEIHIISSDSESEVIILSDCDTDVEFQPPPPKCFSPRPPHRDYIPFITDYEDQSSDSMSDLSTIHHEEIVPDNLKKFLQEEFFKYLHEKYAQKKISKFYHANRVLRKYKKTRLLNKK
ncbi:serine-rich adhesin for platelets [Musca vetustissima]|uniref:serine-rich adhesin for platelets n=1 Tax=Musca vetustissima TaxID=27455 RepID=UPI002AB6B394|nr:serine-rich adhesin for platelets [Musca vetustissima]